MQQSLAKSEPAGLGQDQELRVLVQRARRLDPRLAKLMAAYGAIKRAAVKQTITDFLVEYTKNDNCNSQ